MKEGANLENLKERLAELESKVAFLEKQLQDEQLMIGIIDQKTVVNLSDAQSNKTK